MIEEIARAIKKSGHLGDVISYEDCARAAFSAITKRLREPSEEMLEAVSRSFTSAPNGTREDLAYHLLLDIAIHLEGKS